MTTTEHDYIPPENIEDAIQAEYCAVLSRHPITTEAAQEGFVVGFREDGSHQADDIPNANPPVQILDNYFKNRDLERYLSKFQKYDPAIGVIGDAYSENSSKQLQHVVDQIHEERPYKKLIVVPKCREAFDVLDDNVILGYPNGYSNIHPEEYSDTSDWRGRPIHILGGSPPTQYEVIEELTQPNLYGDPPADIVGLDWNGFHKIAYLGEYWSRDGWQSADHLSIRETVRASVREIKEFWREKGVWPEKDPREVYGEPVREPDEPLYVVNAGDITSVEELEGSLVESYVREGERVTWAFRSETEKAFIEYREGLL